jgi:hypothetical protein
MQENQNDIEYQETDIPHRKTKDLTIHIGRTMRIYEDLCIQLDSLHNELHDLINFAEKYEPRYGTCYRAGSDEVGEIGQQLIKSSLEKMGWEVRRFSEDVGLEDLWCPKYDLLAIKGVQKRYIQVKTTTCFVDLYFELRMNQKRSLDNAMYNSRKSSDRVKNLVFLVSLQEATYWHFLLEDLICFENARGRWQNSFAFDINHPRMREKDFGEVEKDICKRFLNRSLDHPDLFDGDDSEWL